MILSPPDSGPLFAHPSPTSRAAPAQRHSATSQAAAEAIAPRMGELEWLVLGYIEARGDEGATDHEIADEMARRGIERDRSTWRPRRVALWHAGKVVDSGRTRLSPRNRPATVWIKAP